MIDETRMAIAGIVGLITIGTAIFIFEVALATWREMRGKQ